MRSRNPGDPRRICGRILVGLLMLVVPTSGCEHPAPGELDLIPGLYVDYRHSPELLPCAGNAASVNDYAVYVASAMGMPLDELPKMSFSWVTAEDLESWTRGQCSHSCTVGPDAFSRSGVFYHEQAHALYFDVNPRASHFLQEGFATALDPFQLANFTNVMPRDPRSLFTDTTFSSGSYAMAGLFVAYLIQVHGPEKFRALYQKIPEKSSMADWEDAFKTIYGGALDDMVTKYLNATECLEDVEPFPQFECEAPPLEPKSGGWRYERALSCEYEDVVGGIESDNGFAATGTFVVDVPGEYAIAFLAPDVPKSLLRVGMCDGCRWLPMETRFSGGNLMTVSLPEGKHFMTVRLFDVESSEVQVGISPLF